MDREIDFAACYPFTQSARELIKTQGIKISDRLLDIAIERILGTLANNAKKTIALHESEKLEEIAGYAAARMILAYTRNTYLINKFAIIEAKRASYHLSKATDNEFKRVAEELDVVAEETDNAVFVSLPIYLKNSPKSIDYRLVNRDVIGGRVKITTHQWKRLAEEAVKLHVEAMPAVKEMPKEIKEAAKRLLARLPRPKPVATVQDTKLGTSDQKSEASLAPCINALIEDARQHKNLPHQARWLLAVYLIKKGASDEELLAIFSLLPDYDEKITKYQITHARKQDYSVPACATVLSYGLCRAQCGIRSPLQYKGMI